MPPVLLTIREVASLMSVPLQRAYELARTGTIPGVVRIGRQIRVNPAELQRFIDAGGAPLKEPNTV
jgi:excisionase family DNA binding protein